MRIEVHDLHAPNGRGQEEDQDDHIQRLLMLVSAEVRGLVDHVPDHQEGDQDAHIQRLLILMKIEGPGPIDHEEEDPGRDHRHFDQ